MNMISKERIYAVVNADEDLQVGVQNQEQK